MDQSWKSINLILAGTIDKAIHFKCSPKPINNQTFQKFLSEIEDLYWYQGDLMKKEFILYFDNAKAHTSKHV